MKCNICENLEDGDTLYVSSDWDGGIGFDYIRDIKYCPVCGRKLRAEQTEPQTERIKTLDYCDICNHKGCDNCIANNLDDYCVPSGYAPKDTPQTDCDTCGHYKLACELFSEVCKYEPTTQIETQNSNLTFEKCTMRDCYTCRRYETEEECIECHYEPKDKQTEPTTEDCLMIEEKCDRPQMDCDNCWKQLHCRATGRKDWK